ncbi:ferritin [candidate division LCP-89 bacterium B3_LCP]|uniref:Ferritin n=1 Tax=candidate division LCP-89 bacterium B3_LCP TaxID=2012998 RepID=A0A532V4N0_UNCL8|nr:MAG: ferritin [candidate division LCP-89 bacterium B3_LCP]
MLKKKIENALNKHLNAELYSSYLYLSMAAYFHSQNLNGFANWMQVQAQEEMIHVMKFYSYINDRGGQIKMMPIEGPPTQWKSSLDVFEGVYKHEQLVTSLIHKLVDLAVAEKDRALQSFLQWFVDEQVEEEASADDVVQQLKLAGTTGPGLFMLDRELKQRAFTPPADTTE